MTNACASHGSRNTGSPESSGMPGRLAAEVSSGRLEVGFPGIDGNLELRIALGTPQFAALEAYRIAPLRILARPRRVGVGKHVAAAHELDRAGVAADITRQPRVPARMHVSGAHLVARLEPRRGPRLARHRGSAREHPVHIL